MKENWKDIKNYEGIYQVSDLGRVKSLDRIDSAGRRLSGTILKQSRTRGNYLMVGLCKFGTGKLYRVNRLVAIAFIDNKNNLPHVGHIDDDKQNNKLENLYWTDAKENNTHNDKHIRVGEKVGRPVVGVNMEETIVFKSSLEAGRNGFNPSAIRNCISGRSATHKGYVWALMA